MILDEAIMVEVSIETLKLENVQQFYYKCPNKGKI
jgi:ATP-dependent RNA helicase DDX19/DBP5